MSLKTERPCPIRTIATVLEESPCHRGARMKLWLMIIFLCFSSHLTWWCNRLDGQAPSISIGNRQIREVCKMASNTMSKTITGTTTCFMTRSHQLNTFTYKSAELSSNFRIFAQTTDYPAQRPSIINFPHFAITCPLKERK
jgi:hypothetical protein